MREVPANIIRKIYTLDQLAAELRRGKWFDITRLTIIKSLCGDPDAAAQFALWLAKQTQKAMKVAGRGSRRPSPTRQRYQRLINRAVREMTSYLKRRTSRSDSSVHELLREIRDEQNEFERQRWGPVRMIHSRELLVVETALECVLNPWHSSPLGYLLARRYTQRYSSRYPTGLIPASAPMLDDITEYWGRHFLGRSWRKRLTESAGAKQTRS